MYDALTTRYTLRARSGGDPRAAVRVPRPRPAPGAGHPAVFQVVFDCPCGDGAPGARVGRRARLGAARTQRRALPEPDDRPLRGRRPRSSPTSQSGGSWTESGRGASTATRRSRPRPVFPSSFFLLAPGDGSLGLAVRCPSCGHVSVNLVSPEHVDVPFHNDRRVGVVAARARRRRSSGSSRSSTRSSTPGASTLAA